MSGFRIWGNRLISPRDCIVTLIFLLCPPPTENAAGKTVKLVFNTLHNFDYQFLYLGKAMNSPLSLYCLISISVVSTSFWKCTGENR